jgi:type III secretory pathway component EscT
MTENYVSLYINSPFSQQGPAALLGLMFLFLARMLPIIAQAPFFGARLLPNPVKVALGLSLFAILFPQLSSSVKEPIGFNFLLILYFFKELLIGTIIGFMISIPFSIAQNAGIMIDHQRGGASLMVNDPTIQNQSSPLGTLFNFVLIYLFFMIDGPFLVIDAVAQSYEVLPPDRFVHAGFFAPDSQIAVEVGKLVGVVMIVSTQLAAPALIVILMTDFFLGIANRLAPQVQITFLGMPLKSLLALAIIFFGWQLFTTQLITESYKWLSYIFNLIKLFTP